MGEADHWIQQNVIRFMMNSSYEHTHFETATNPVISLKNSDEHSRLLVDPAYRLEQLKLAEDKAKVMFNTIERIQLTIEHQHGKPQVVTNKDTYENVINAEIAIAELDQHFKNVQRFNIRYFLDPDNHERREKRMNERSTQRTQRIDTLYLNGVTESELRYRDYFESDDEALKVLVPNKAQIKHNVLSNPDYKITNFDFQEQYTNTREKDSSSYIKKKVFRFNHRQAFVSPQDHERKDRRMMDRLHQSQFVTKLQSITGQNVNGLLNNTQQLIDKIGFYDLVVNQAVENYKNYFESDLEDDFAYFEALPPSDKKEFIETFAANGLIIQGNSTLGTLYLPFDSDPQEGIVKRSLDFWEHFNDFVVPAYNNLNQVNRSQDLLDEALKTVTDKTATQLKSLN
jgi:hypothetical protein